MVGQSRPDGVFGKRPAQKFGHPGLTFFNGKFYKKIRLFIIFIKFSKFVEIDS